MMTNEELVKAFLQGETEGRASNMEIRETRSGTALIGYEKMVYGVRSSSTGKIAIFPGWRSYMWDVGLSGHSRTAVKKQMNLVQFGSYTRYVRTFGGGKVRRCISKVVESERPESGDSIQELIEKHVQPWWPEAEVHS